MSIINSIQAIQIIDSRGIPTVSCKVILDNGIRATSMVPSGASTGSREALELRDGDSTYMGKGVGKAVANIHEIIAPALIGMDVTNQQGIDEKMLALDGTSSKAKLGANAILGVSLAVLDAGSQTLKLPLYQYINQVFADINGEKPMMQMPTPMLNIINGGEHADNNIDIQEFMIMPVGANNFSQAMQWATEIYSDLKNILNVNGLSTSVGDEGGFAPNLQSNQEAIELILQAIRNNNLTAGNDVGIALDCAASEFYDNGIYNLQGESTKLNSTEFTKYLTELTRQYPIFSIEDGMDESDFEGWKNAVREVSKFENVAIKISGFGEWKTKWTTEFISDYVNIAIDSFGTKRCMFASNFPVDKFISNSSYDSFWLSYYKIVSNFSAHEIDDLLVNNAEQYYKI